MSWWIVFKQNLVLNNLQYLICQLYNYMLFFSGKNSPQQIYFLIFYIEQFIVVFWLVLLYSIFNTEKLFHVAYTMIGSYILLISLLGLPNK